MKAKTILLVTLLLIFGVSTSAYASFVQENLDPVRFWLLDDTSASGDNDSVTLDLFNFNLAENWYLQYKTGSVWLDWPSSSPFSVVQNELIYFRITEGYSFDDNCKPVFSGYEDRYCAIHGYGPLIIFWYDDSIAAINYDHVGPVPIPSTVWIFGAGLIALVGIKRKLRV